MPLIRAHGVHFAGKTHPHLSPPSSAHAGSHLHRAFPLEALKTRTLPHTEVGVAKVINA